MIYYNIVQAKFLSRPNRFIAYAELEGQVVECHVKNTGRCKELLIPGATVYLQEADKPDRKTKYDLISVVKGDRLINMDSQVPNKVFAEWVRKGNLVHNITRLQPECRYHNSRFDFYIEGDDRKIFVEVKGVTLEEDGVVLFPDAPTERGVRHIQELCDCVREGYEAYIVFIIQMKDVLYFTPNVKTHKAFGEVLKIAGQSKVNILALDCHVTPDGITAADFVRVEL